MTATVETVVEQLDLTPVMPAIARAITLTESDVGNLYLFIVKLISIIYCFYIIVGNQLKQNHYQPI